MKRIRNYFESALRVLAAPGCLVIWTLTLLALVIPLAICKIFGVEEPEGI